MISACGEGGRDYRALSVTVLLVYIWSSGGYGNPHLLGK